MKRSIMFLIIILLFIPNIVYAKKYKCTYVSRDSISNCSRNKDPDKCDVDITPFLNQAVTIIFDEDKLVDNYEMEINIKGTNFQSKYNIFNVAHTAAGGLHNFIDSYSDTHDDFSTFCGDSISTLYFACGLSTTYNV